MFCPAQLVSLSFRLSKFCLALLWPSHHMVSGHLLLEKLHGGWCWGNRVLVPILPIIFIPFIFVSIKSRASKSILLFLTLASGGFQLTAVCTKTHECSVLRDQITSTAKYTPKSASLNHLSVSAQTGQRHTALPLFSSWTFIRTHYRPIFIRLFRRTESEANPCAELSWPKFALSQRFFGNACLAHCHHVLIALRATHPCLNWKRHLQ